MSNDYYQPSDSVLPLFSARRNDPETSKAAGRRSRTFSGGHREKILDALATGPGTKDVIATRCGLTEQQTARRMHELKRDGLVEVVGVEISPTGSPESVYAARAATDAGR